MMTTSFTSSARVNNASQKAKEIGETGITGAYEEEFQVIEEMLKKIKEEYDSSAQDGLEKFVKKLE